MVPAVEKAMVDSGIILVKYWLEVSADEQTRRLESRIDDPRKIWKLSDMDLKSYSRWYDYSRARDDMFAATDTDWAPWYVAHSDDKKRARLNVITHLLSQVPYEPIHRKKVALPDRDRSDGYTESGAPRRYIPSTVLTRDEDVARRVQASEEPDSNPRRPRGARGRRVPCRGSPGADEVR